MMRKVLVYLLLLTAAGVVVFLVVFAFGRRPSLATTSSDPPDGRVNCWDFGNENKLWRSLRDSGERAEKPVRSLGESCISFLNIERMRCS